MKRREFMRRSALGAAVLSADTWVCTRTSRAQVNEQISIGIIGCGSWGSQLTIGLAENERCRIVSVCDPDELRMQGLARRLKDTSTARDFRELLDRKDIDAVVIATPTHWNALAAINAIQSGKDVYLETPLTHNLREWQCISDSALKYGRVVQSGFQMRSDPQIAALSEEVQAIGKVRLVHVIVSRPDILATNQHDSSPPATLDYNLWLGPSSIDIRYNESRVQKDWRWFWQHGTGVLGNDGSRLFDLACHLVEIPPINSFQISSDGGFVDGLKTSTAPQHAQDATVDVTPNIQTTVYQAPGMRMIWEHRAFLSSGSKSKAAVRLIGTKGVLEIDLSGWHRHQHDRLEVAEEDIKRKLFKSSLNPRPHLNAFLQAVMTRKPNVGDLSTTRSGSDLVHLGNIATRLGRDGRTRSSLQYEPEKSIIVGSEEASQLLTRQYRKGFELPRI